MSVMHRLRIYHALLASLVVVAYASGDLEPVHNWIGYAVALIIAARLVWAATGVPQLGLTRFYPKFEGLKLGTAMTHPAISRALLLGIAACLIGATATGVAMDEGRALGIAGARDELTPAGPVSARADSTKHAVREEHGAEGDDESPMSEAHEFFANLLVGFVGLHVGYLLLFKRPLARFMLFIDRPKT